MLAVEGLGKRYDAIWVVRRLEFELKQGDALVVLGPNGAGKSTLLRMIAGLVAPTEGEIRRPAGDPRRAIGMASLEHSLYPHLTVREHLEFSAKVRGCDPDLPILATAFGLSDRLDQPARELSTGVRSRVRLAIAVQARPKVLLLDEPGASLDDAGRDAVEAACRDQRERGVLLLATNDATERRLGNLELELAV